MNDPQKQEPTDAELRAIGQRAQERRARELGDVKPIATAAKLFAVPKIAIPSRGVRCPSCDRFCHQRELEQDGSKCDECQLAIERKAEKASREFRERIEKIPAAYRGDPIWSRDVLPPFLPEDAIRMGLEWLESKAPRLSIFGDQTGSGKSTLAAFVALAGIRDGQTWEWVHASDLVPDHEVQEQAKEAVRIARTAPRVVVDGFGKEFRGQDPTNGWGKRKQEWTSALIGRAHQSTNQRFVFTFDMSIERFADIYDRDASLLRRVAPDDGKTVIVLRRQGQLRVARGTK